MTENSAKIDHLLQALQAQLIDVIESVHTSFGEITIDGQIFTLKSLLLALRENFSFDQLMDVCAVDYLHYGQYDFETDPATALGFSRAVDPFEARAVTWDKPRFSVVYHLLSTKENVRVRVRVFVDETHLIVPSVCDIWKSANWFEREAYDLYGILFEGHPDLRRILTDYGFIGHPFRKDFPVSGQVEMRYDATLKKVIYEPVDIVPRVSVPKVIRHDNRYEELS